MSNSFENSPILNTKKEPSVLEKEYTEEEKKILKNFEDSLFRMKYGDNDALEIKEKFPNIDFTNIIQNYFLSSLEFSDSEHNALKIKEQFPDIDYSQKNIILLINKRFNKCLLNGKFNNALKIQETFPNVDYAEAIQKSFENVLFKDSIYMIDYTLNKIKETFPNVVLCTESIQKSFENFLSEGDLDNAFKIKAFFPDIDYSKKEVTEAAQKAFENVLFKGDLDDALKIQERFPDIDYTESIQKGFVNQLYKGALYDALKIQKIFPNVDYSKKEVIEGIQKGFENVLSEGHLDYALKIKENFPDVDYSKKEVTEAAQKGFENVLSKGNLDNALKIKETFPDIDYTESIQKGFEACLLNENIDNALLFLANFKVLNPIEKINNNLNIKQYLNIIQLEIPDILKNKEENPEFILKLYLNKDNFLYAIKHKDEYPWLKDAILGNDRFSDKLFLQWIKFDKISKKNIDFIFRVKENIIKDNSIDENSLEFRILMQEALKKYENNPKILEHLNNIGVDLESWLNYEKEDYIKLGKAEDISFADMVKTPVARMSETFDEYKNSFKAIFKEYQKELQEYKTPLESVDEINKSINDMRLRIQEAKDNGIETSKIQGMEKGLSTLEMRKNNPKTAPLWQKILSDFDAIVVLSNDIVKIHNILEVNESKYKELSDKDNLEKSEREELFKYKKLISKDINEFKNKLNTLEQRMNFFKDNLPNMIKPCLGEDRTFSLMQEFKENTNEVLDHLSSDINSSQTALEKVLENQDNNKLEGRFVKIGVWGRNPDRDLYLGNYTNCCIRIDSEHMNEESTIADYLTDCGIQVVTVVDENTNNPIVACWVYVGEDNNGKPKMVIDNIEANTDYINYFSLLKSNLENYFAEYAEKVKIGKENISQGRNNNDIILNTEVGDFYNKAGGYNRDEGYFLEAEPGDYDNEDNDDDDEDEEE